MVMDTDEYEQKVTTMLSDDKTYEKLKKDPKIQETVSVHHKKIEGS